MSWYNDRGELVKGRKPGSPARKPRPEARGPEKVPTSEEIAWAAGIFDGEGTCSGHNQRCVRVYQKDPWLLRRLQEMFGGSCYLRPSAQGVWIWEVSGYYGRAFSAVIYPWLSPIRQRQLLTNRWVDNEVMEQQGSYPQAARDAWAAGIYEGEGSATGTGLRVYQNDPWMLHRLQEAFGGAVRLYKSAEGCWSWDVSGDTGRRFMAAIKKWLSPRRQKQIAAKSWLQPI